MKSNLIISDIEKWKHDTLSLLMKCLPLGDQRIESFRSIFFSKREIEVFTISDWVNYRWEDKNPPFHKKREEIKRMLIGLQDFLAKKI